MTEKRFRIECNGIIDNWKSTNTGNDCKDRLSWSELCDTLNELDKKVNEKFDEYKYITELENEVQYLKLKLTGLSALTVKMQKDLENMRAVIEDD